MVVVAALQIGSLENTAETLKAIKSFRQEIIDCGAKIVVLPEATLGGYPKSRDFGTVLGMRSPEGREEYRLYYENAVTIPGPEISELADLSASTGATLVVGVIERDGSTLYCTAVILDPKQGYVAKHRKLMPTASERLIWGQGDGSTLPTVETEAGRLGTAVCWENYMPLLRTAMYSKGVDVWCAPTVDDREMWRVSMRHIAYEGRMFVVSAVQFQDSPKNLGVDLKNWKDETQPLINGGSVIVDPMGNVLAGPLIGKTGLVSAEIDLSEIPRARYDFDPVGHYSRGDVFHLQVNETPQKCVSFK